MRYGHEAILRAGYLLLALIAPAVVPGIVTAQTDDDCMACHSDRELKRADGGSLFLDLEAVQASTHGLAGLNCLDCHADLKGFQDFPHTEKLRPVECAGCHQAAGAEMEGSVHGSQTQRRQGFPVRCQNCHGSHEIKPAKNLDSNISPANLPRTCGRCHLGRVKNGRGKEFIRLYEKSIHFRAIERSGLTLSASCTNCHGAHDIKGTADAQSHVSRRNIIQTCGHCHVGILRDYLEGVHGKDYVKGIKEVPVCTDCHSEHAILPPQETASKVYSTRVAELCAKCHDNLTIARQYNMTPSRLKTFSDTFHGTALKFGETRVANCASCHGFHDIRAASDPKSSINPANLPQTCGQCHAGAGENFARGQVHAVQDETVAAKYRSSHLVKRIYLILITIIVSSLIVFIAADLFRRHVNRKRHG